MFKVFMIGLALFALGVLINWFAPSLWINGPTIPIGNGVLFPYGLIVLGVVGYLGFK